ncbi:hypothetical protein [Calidifontibacillus erzurumensis]|uniref:hypothetical protein n=1 Tax=Calidifontibacillus erzurumensis TaxID=2741433 RepID=UPI0035B54911
MKHFKIVIAFLGILSIFIAGCFNPISSEEQIINVQKRIGDGYKYENFKEINDRKQVQ